MQIENVRLQIKTLATGVSVLGISKGNLAKVNLSVPSKPEQTKIANFLTAIDDKITNNQTQLNAMKQYKQGLLQQMFV
jgi:type I restriction enzyme S subunit